MSQEELSLSQPAGNQAAQQRLDQVKEVSKDTVLELLKDLTGKFNKFEQQTLADRKVKTPKKSGNVKKM